MPSGAHLFALNNKIGMPEDQYLIVQSIYRGWQFAGAVWIAALLANVAPAVRMRGERAAFLWALAAAILILRIVWEYSYAVNAFAAPCSTTLSVILSRK